MKSVKKYVDKTLLFITATLFLVMVSITTWQVIARYILNNPSTLTEEFVRFSLIWLSMLAASYVVGKRSHIAFTIISDRFKGSKKLGLEIFIQAIFLIFSLVVMLFGGGKAISLTMAQMSPSLGIPMGLVYLSLPVSGILITFYSCYNLVEVIKEKKAPVTEDKEEDEYNKVGEII
ncbi:TRAP transporter small permease [Gracilibacillus sp. YIM 98692]|uniref:TRAP transporter small permease n=1 Tax=Gracilibacillus sp. YIM 98692 TaxID=2663532 RepID=UPI0013D33AC0|nr:TRAP transporter small permease [Gracilibacillus sp. YIM 98692]